MNGILIVDKPSGMTSHDVVSRARRALGTKRVGHTGTLDPFATGVLVLLVGKATRLARFVDKDEKEYEATITFGFETDTGDRDGLRIADRGSLNEELVACLVDTDWEALFSRFRGEIMQTPPMYSAKKFKGRKLYELARKGVDVERKPVPVSIYELELLSDESRTRHPEIRIRVVCSAGTYIRTLAEDIGRAVGVGAHLAELRRTRSGRFTLNEAVLLEDLETLDDPTTALRPITEVVAHLPEINLSVERAERTKHGLATLIDGDDIPEGTALRMLDPSAELVAIGIYDREQKTVKPTIVLV